MNRVLVIVMCGALGACAAGKAVRVNCDGPLTLINPPVTPDSSKAAPPRPRGSAKTEARKP